MDGVFDFKLFYDACNALPYEVMTMIKNKMLVIDALDAYHDACMKVDVFDYIEGEDTGVTEWRETVADFQWRRDEMENIQDLKYKVKNLRGFVWTRWEIAAMFDKYDAVVLDLYDCCEEDGVVATVIAHGSKICDFYHVGKSATSQIDTGKIEDKWIYLTAQYGGEDDDEEDDKDQRYYELFGDSGSCRYEPEYLKFNSCADTLDGLFDAVFGKTTSTFDFNVIPMREMKK